MIKTRTYIRWKTIISDCLQSPLFWLLLLCFTFRNFYEHLYVPDINYYSDTVTYYYAAQHVFNGIVDAFRTPVYPMVIKVIQAIDERSVFNNIVYFQKTVSFISIIAFYLFCKRWYHVKYLQFTATLIYGCMPAIIYYNIGIFPESLLLSSLTFLLYFFSEYIRQPNPNRAILLNLFILYLVLLKPGCIYLYGVLGMIWILKLFYEKNRAHFKYEITGFIVSVLLLFGYCLVNKKQNGVLGLSTVSHDNNFANIILSNAYKYLSDKRFIAAIDSVKEKGIYYSIYYLNNDYYRYQKCYKSFPEAYPYTEDMTGVSNVPPNNYGYTRAQLDAYIKEAMLSKPYLQYIINEFETFIHFRLLFVSGYMLYLLFLIESILILQLVIRRKRISWIHLFCFLVLAGIIGITLIGGIDDGTRRRVLMPVAPFLIIFTIGFIDRLLIIIFQKNGFEKILNYCK